jgi:hypothetical protein
MKKEFEQNENEALNKTDVKCRFFMNYYGQEVFAIDEKEAIRINSKTISYMGQKSFLRLKSVSKITDDDCILIFNKFYPNAIRYSDAEKVYDIKATIKSNFSEDVIIDNDFIFYTDFMRSKGYAVPFMEYSVEDLISFGWVRFS